MLPHTISECLFFISSIILVNEVYSQIPSRDSGFRQGKQGKIHFETAYSVVPYDSIQRDRFQSCDASSYCTPIRRCTPLRRGVGASCGPYGRVCCSKEEFRIPVQIPPLRSPVQYTPVQTRARENSEECGLSKELYREQNPSTADGSGTTWPWMVAIRFQNSTGSSRFWCSGFLIDRTHVLSAAHCFDPIRYKGRFIAHIGSDDQELAEEYPIAQIKTHEDFRPGSSYDDIAIVTLAREVDFPNFVPVCLPDDQVAAMDLTGRESTIVGWGSETLFERTNNTLKQLDNVPIVANVECNQIYDELSVKFRTLFPRGITLEMMCAGQTGDVKNSCKGDSGGPLMILYRQRWFAVGITAFSVSCGLAGVPSIFTSISSYADWIERNIV